MDRDLLKARTPSGRSDSSGRASTDLIKGPRPPRRAKLTNWDANRESFRRSGTVDTYNRQADAADQRFAQTQERQRKAQEDEERRRIEEADARAKAELGRRNDHTMRKAQIEGRDVWKNSAGELEIQQPSREEVIEDRENRVAERKAELTAREEAQRDEWEKDRKQQVQRELWKATQDQERSNAEMESISDLAGGNIENILSLKDPSPEDQELIRTYKEAKARQDEANRRFEEYSLRDIDQDHGDFDDTAEAARTSAKEAAWQEENTAHGKRVEEFKARREAEVGKLTNEQEEWVAESLRREREEGMDPVQRREFLAEQRAKELEFTRRREELKEILEREEVDLEAQYRHLAEQQETLFPKEPTKEPARQEEVSPAAKSLPRVEKISAIRQEITSAAQAAHDEQRKQIRLKLRNGTIDVNEAAELFQEADAASREASAEGEDALNEELFESTLDYQEDGNEEALNAAFAAAGIPEKGIDAYRRITQGGSIKLRRNRETERGKALAQKIEEFAEVDAENVLNIKAGRKRNAILEEIKDGIAKSEDPEKFIGEASASINRLNLNRNSLQEFREELERGWSRVRRNALKGHINGEMLEVAGGARMMIHEKSPELLSHERFSDYIDSAKNYVSGVVPYQPGVGWLGYREVTKEEKAHLHNLWRKAQRDQAAMESVFQMIEGGSGVDPDSGERVVWGVNPADDLQSTFMGRVADNVIATSIPYMGTAAIPGAGFVATAYAFKGEALDRRFEIQDELGIELDPETLNLVTTVEGAVMGGIEYLGKAAALGRAALKTGRKAVGETLTVAAAKNLDGAVVTFLKEGAKQLGVEFTEEVLQAINPHVTDAVLDVFGEGDHSALKDHHLGLLATTQGFLKQTPEMLVGIALMGSLPAVRTGLASSRAKEQLMRDFDPDGMNLGDMLLVSGYEPEIAKRAIATRNPLERLQILQSQNPAEMVENAQGEAAVAAQGRILQAREAMMEGVVAQAAAEEKGSPDQSYQETFSGSPESIAQSIKSISGPGTVITADEVSSGIEVLGSNPEGWVYREQAEVDVSRAIGDASGALQTAASMPAVAAGKIQVAAKVASQLDEARKLAKSAPTEAFLAALPTEEAISQVSREALLAQVELAEAAIKWTNGGTLTSAQKARIQEEGILNETETETPVLTDEAREMVLETVPQAEPLLGMKEASAIQELGRRADLAEQVAARQGKPIGQSGVNAIIEEASEDPRFTQVEETSGGVMSTSPDGRLSINRDTLAKLPEERARQLVNHELIHQAIFDLKRRGDVTDEQLLELLSEMEQDPEGQRLLATHRTAYYSTEVDEAARTKHRATSEEGKAKAQAALEAILSGDREATTEDRLALIEELMTALVEDAEYGQIAAGMNDVLLPKLRKLLEQIGQALNEILGRVDPDTRAEVEALRDQIQGRLQEMESMVLEETEVVDAAKVIRDAPSQRTGRMLTRKHGRPFKNTDYGRRAARAAATRQFGRENYDIERETLEVTNEDGSTEMVTGWVAYPHLEKSHVNPQAREALVGGLEQILIDANEGMTSEAFSKRIDRVYRNSQATIIELRSVHGAFFPSGLAVRGTIAEMKQDFVNYFDAIQEAKASFTPSAGRKERAEPDAFERDSGVDRAEEMLTELRGELERWIEPDYGVLRERVQRITADLTKTELLELVERREGRKPPKRTSREEANRELSLFGIRFLEQNHLFGDGNVVAGRDIDPRSTIETGITREAAEVSPGHWLKADGKSPFKTGSSAKAAITKMVKAGTVKEGELVPWKIEGGFELRKVQKTQSRGKDVGLDDYETGVLMTAAGNPALGGFMMTGALNPSTQFQQDVAKARATAKKAEDDLADIDPQRLPEELRLEYEAIQAERVQAMIDLGLDIAGVLEPTPFSDGFALIRALRDDRPVDAALSAVSLLPYIGDAVAKPGKLIRTGKRLRGIARRARKLREKLSGGSVRNAPEPSPSGRRRYKPIGQLAKLIRRLATRPQSPTYLFDPHGAPIDEMRIAANADDQAAVLNGIIDQIEGIRRGSLSESERYVVHLEARQSVRRMRDRKEQDMSQEDLFRLALALEAQADFSQFARDISAAQIAHGKKLGVSVGMDNVLLVQDLEEVRADVSSGGLRTALKQAAAEFREQIKSQATIAAIDEDGKTLDERPYDDAALLPDDAADYVLRSQEDYWDGFYTKEDPVFWLDEVAIQIEGDEAVFEDKLIIAEIREGRVVDPNTGETFFDRDSPPKSRNAPEPSLPNEERRTRTAAGSGDSSLPRVSDAGARLNRGSSSAGNPENVSPGTIRGVADYLGIRTHAGDDALIAKEAKRIGFGGEGKILIHEGVRYKKYTVGTFPTRLPIAFPKGGQIGFGAKVSIRPDGSINVALERGDAEVFQRKLDISQVAPGIRPEYALAAIENKKRGRGDILPSNSVLAEAQDLKEEASYLDIRSWVQEHEFNPVVQGKEDGTYLLLPLNDRRWLFQAVLRAGEKFYILDDLKEANFRKDSEGKVYIADFAAGEIPPDVFQVLNPGLQDLMRQLPDITKNNTPRNAPEPSRQGMAPQLPFLQFDDTRTTDRPSQQGQGIPLEALAENGIDRRRSTRTVPQERREHESSILGRWATENGRDIDPERFDPERHTLNEDEARRAEASYEEATGHAIEILRPTDFEARRLGEIGRSGPEGFRTSRFAVFEHKELLDTENQGFYEPDTDVLFINWRALSKEGGSPEFTLGHEYGHRIHEHDPDTAYRIWAAYARSVDPVDARFFEEAKSNYDPNLRPAEIMADLVSEALAARQMRESRTFLWAVIPEDVREEISSLVENAKLPTQRNAPEPSRTDQAAETLPEDIDKAPLELLDELWKELGVNLDNWTEVTKRYAMSAEAEVAGAFTAEGRAPDAESAVDRANPGESDFAREQAAGDRYVYDTHLKGVRTDDEVNDAAQAILDDSQRRNELEAHLMAVAVDGKSLMDFPVGMNPDTATVASKGLLNQLYDEAEQTGNPTTMARAHQISFAYAEFGTELARGLRQRRDAIMGPEERAKHHLRRAFGELNPGARDRLTQVEAGKKRQQALEFELSEQQRRIDMALERAGLTTDDILAGQAVALLRTSALVTRTINQTASTDTERKIMQEIVTERTPPRRIARKHNLKRGDVMKARDRLEAAWREELRRQYELGVDLADIGQLTKPRRRAPEPGTRNAPPIKAPKSPSAALEANIERRVANLFPPRRDYETGAIRPLVKRRAWDPDNQRATAMLLRTLQSSNAGFFGVLNEMRISSMLSAPKTLISSVFLGNLVAGTQELFIQRSWNAIVNQTLALLGAGKDPDSATFAEFRALGMGLQGAWRDAWANASLAFATETDVFTNRILDEEIDFAKELERGGMKAAASEDLVYQLLSKVPLIGNQKLHEEARLERDKIMAQGAAALEAKIRKESERRGFENEADQEQWISEQVQQRASRYLDEWNAQATKKLSEMEGDTFAAKAQKAADTIGLSKIFRGRVTRLSLRAMMGIDAAMRTMLGRMEVGMLAHREAMKFFYQRALAEGLEGEQAWQRAQKIAQEPAPRDREGMSKGATRLSDYIAKQVDTPGSASWLKTIGLMDRSVTYTERLRKERASESKNKPEYDTAKDRAQRAIEKENQDRIETGQVPYTDEQMRNRVLDLTNAQLDGSPSLVEKAGAWIGELKRGKQVRFLANWYFPFVNAPTLIVDKFLRRSLLGFLYVAHHRRKRQDKGGALDSYNRAAQIEDYANISQGLAITGAALVFARALQGDDDDEKKKFLITGAGPSFGTNEALREHLQREHGGSMTVRFGTAENGVNFTYRKGDPWAGAIALAVDIGGAFKMQGGNLFERIAAAGLVGAPAVQAKLEETPFTAGLTELQKDIDAFKRFTAGQTGADRAKRLARDTLTKFTDWGVPNLLKSILRESDPFIRDSADQNIALDYLPASRVLELMGHEEAAAPPKRDLTGAEMKRSGNALLRIPFDLPLERSEGADTKFHEFIEAYFRVHGGDTDVRIPRSWRPHNYTISTLEQKSGKRRMTPKEREKFNEMVAEELHRRVNRIVSTRDLQEPSKEVMNEVVKALDDSREHAKKMLFAEHREFKRRPKSYRDRVLADL